MAKPAPKKSSPAPKTPAKTPAPSTPPNGIAGTPMAEPIAETPVRKTVAPKATPAGVVVTRSEPREITYDQIAERAYHISRSGNGGSEDDNWHRAERELRSENV